MLTLWKRHSATCLASLAKNKKLAADQRRFHKGCQCACWVTGMHPITNEYVKKALGTTSWEAAEKLKMATETKTTEQVEADGLTITKALAVWSTDKERVGTASTTMRNYRSLTNQILAYAKAHGLVLLSQLTPARAYEMAVAWEGKPSTNAMRITRLKEFGAFAVKREWVAKDPTTAIDRPSVGRDQVEPYSPEEEAKIEAALDTWTSVLSRLKGGRWSLRPTTFKCLVHVFKDTGLRISDAMRVRPEIVEPSDGGGGKVTLEQMKTDRRGGGRVTVYLRADTVEELRTVPRISAKYPFMEECADERDRNLWKEHVFNQAQRAREALRLLGKASGVHDVRPHRFRHTLAIKKLMSGWALEDVSRLLGHSSINITEKYYAKWTAPRQARLEEKVRRDWEQDGIISIVRKKTTKKGRAA